MSDDDGKPDVHESFHALTSEQKAHMMATVPDLYYAVARIVHRREIARLFDVPEMFLGGDPL